MQQIVIDINQNGTVAIDAQGFQGPDCLEATAAFERALGTVLEERKKPEYAQKKAQKVERTRSRGT